MDVQGTTGVAVRSFVQLALGLAVVNAVNLALRSRTYTPPQIRKFRTVFKYALRRRFSTCSFVF